MAPIHKQRIPVQAQNKAEGLPCCSGKEESAETAN